ncbi:GNAT family N-acetyltransferase [Tellurirhabdus rosea]|uniref:GNAT family N-acetyltransferase n=1 Tax=Tellurirhabdus rosea TaxID=2674997 RepID=UPI0022573931|nr:GNAT family N-acetyltransferase [Tellurirhabdus rosea]
MSTADIIIRPAVTADSEALCRLARQTMWEAFGPPHNRAEDVLAYLDEALTPDLTREELADPKARFLVAETAAGELVGYAKLRRQRPPRQLRGQQAIEIQRLYVAHNQVGTGLGRRLMDACRELARAEGFQVFWLGVWERNERAIAFYKKMGFSRIGWHYFQFGSERQRDYWMSNNLLET